MWSILALGAVERVIHHVIDLDAITRIQLNALSGKMLRVVIASPQLSVDVFFDKDKLRLEPTATGHSEASSIFEQRPFDAGSSTVTEATATLQVSNVVELLKLLLSDEVGNIPLQGDYKLLQKQLKRTLQSQLFFAEDALKEDSGLFAPRWQMDDLNQDTRILNQNLDRVEAKIQQLQAQIDTSNNSTQD